VYWYVAGCWCFDVDLVCGVELCVLGGVVCALEKG
jgi:hypothetical protein